MGQKKKIIIAVVFCVVILFVVGIYFVRREWKSYAENNPLYIVPTAYDFPYKNYNRNTRIQFDGFSLLVPDDFHRVDTRSKSKWYKSSYSVLIVEKDRFDFVKRTLERENIYYESEYAAHLYVLSITPDDCISVNPVMIMRNCKLKRLKSRVSVSDLKKIYYRDFGSYSVIVEQMRRGCRGIIYREGDRYALISYFSNLELLDQNAINQILSTVEFDK